MNRMETKAMARPTTAHCLVFALARAITQNCDCFYAEKHKRVNEEMKKKKKREATRHLLPPQWVNEFQQCRWCGHSSIRLTFNSAFLYFFSFVHAQFASSVPLNSSSRLFTSTCKAEYFNSTSGFCFGAAICSFNFSASCGKWFVNFNACHFIGTRPRYRWRQIGDWKRSLENLVAKVDESRIDGK